METTAQTKAVPASLEFPVMLHASGQQAVMGIIERLTRNECFIRSLVAFGPGTKLEFELIVHGGAHAKLRGSIVETLEKLPRRYYTLRLDTLPVAEADALDRIAAELHARQSGVKTAENSGALARSSVRAPVDFAVGYAVEGGGHGTGRAANISTGGMLIVNADPLTVGATLELSFMLEVRGQRREATTSARIVAHQQRPDGTWSIHLAFFRVDPSVKAEIEAYVADG